jgi:hypothetical protein
VPEFDEWLFDSARKAGDTDLFERDYTSSCNYYVIVYEGRALVREPAHDVRHILIQAGDGVNPTQAEYDGIPEEERKGLYIVTDANTAFPEGGEVYSTLETRIGTWIDGKPIYRRVIETTIPNATGKWLPAERVDNVDKVIRLDTFVERADLTFPGNFGTHFYVGYLLKESSIGVYIGSNQADYIGRPFYAIIEYTKPTGQGGE